MQREIKIACDWLPGVEVTFNMMIAQPELEKFLSSTAAEGLSAIVRVDGWNKQDGPETGADAPWGFRYWCASEKGFLAAVEEFKTDPNSPTA